jgi:hypothetical protein
MQIANDVTLGAAGLSSILMGGLIFLAMDVARNIRAARYPN